MASLHEVARVAHQIAPTAVGAAGSTTSAAAQVAATCDLSNEFDGRLGLRISAIFVILVGSLFGWSPVFSYLSSSACKNWNKR